MLTKIKIFEILKRNWIFFENVDRSPDFWNFERKSKFFRKCCPKWRFSKFWTEIEIFSKMFIEVEIFEILNQNPNYFRICWPKSRFSKFWTEIDFFFVKSRPESRSSKFWNEIDFFFRKPWQESSFRNFEPNSNFPEMLTETEIFKMFNRNRFFFENVDRIRDLRNFELKLKFFRKCWLKSRFS